MVEFIFVDNIFGMFHGYLFEYFLKRTFFGGLFDKNLKVFVHDGSFNWHQDFPYLLDFSQHIQLVRHSVN